MNSHIRISSLTSNIRVIQHKTDSHNTVSTHTNCEVGNVENRVQQVVTGIKRSVEEGESQPRKYKYWTIEEETRFFKAMEEEAVHINCVSWIRVANKVETRNNASCQAKWKGMLASSKGIWTEGQDGNLLNAVKKYGKNHWSIVAHNIGSNDHECFVRWVMVLKPKMESHNHVCIDRFNTTLKDKNERITPPPTTQPVAPTVNNQPQLNLNDTEFDLLNVMCKGNASEFFRL